LLMGAFALVITFLMMGCPPTKTVEVIGEGTVSDSPPDNLPMCVKVYAGGPARQFWRAIKIPIPEGEVHPDVPAQRHMYKLCGKKAFGGRPLGHPFSIDSKCDVTGEQVVGSLYRPSPRGYDPTFIDIVEVNERCRDIPISGSCKTGYNCEEFFERTPYPPTCTALVTRRLGTCDAMWNISTATGDPL